MVGVPSIDVHRIPPCKSEVPSRALAKSDSIGQRTLGASLANVSVDAHLSWLIFVTKLHKPDVNQFNLRHWPTWLAEKSVVIGISSNITYKIAASLNF